jgi:hypothetical protein
MGGGSESKTELPQWYSDYAKPSLELANQVAQVGFTPMLGTAMAAFNPVQEQAMQAGLDWAAAFNPGQPTQPTIKSQLMPTNSTFNGQPAYSTYPMYQELMDQWKTLFPGQAADVGRFSKDPVTGGPASAYDIFPTSTGGGGGSNSPAPLTPEEERRNRWRDQTTARRSS